MKINEMNIKQFFFEPACFKITLIIPLYLQTMVQSVILEMNEELYNQVKVQKIYKQRRTIKLG